LLRKMVVSEVHGALAIGFPPRGAFPPVWATR
jgi:hypothetical protein